LLLLPAGVAADAGAADGYMQMWYCSTVDCKEAKLALRMCWNAAASLDDAAAAAASAPGRGAAVGAKACKA